MHYYYLCFVNATLPYYLNVNLQSKCHPTNTLSHFFSFYHFVSFKWLHLVWSIYVVLAQTITFHLYQFKESFLLGVSFVTGRQVPVRWNLKQPIRPCDLFWSIFIFQLQLNKHDKNTQRVRHMISCSKRLKFKESKFTKSCECIEGALNCKRWPFTRG